MLDGCDIRIQLYQLATNSAAGGVAVSSATSGFMRMRGTCATSPDL